MAHQPNHEQENAEHTGKPDHHVPDSGVLFFIKIDGEKLSFDHQFVTGREILEAAKKIPASDYDLYLKSETSGKKLIEPADKVNLLNAGLEKFNTIPKKRTDGRDNSSMAPLTEEDFGFLDSSGEQWSAEAWQNNRLLKIENYKLPPGYNRETTSVALLIPLTYPSAQIDMFYFYPSLQRLDGKPINALADQDFNGTIWQRWSRHRTAESAWRAGLDCVETHLCLMDACLREELAR